MTEWRPVVGWEGLYEVSEYGEVKRLFKPRGGPRISNGIRKQVDNAGYKQVGLRKDGKLYPFKTHQIVAAAFIGPRIEGVEINHKDGNKANNHFTNLEYVTHAENMLHSVRALGKAPPKGEKHGMAKRSAEEIQEARKMLANGTPKKEVAAAFGMSLAWAYDLTYGGWGNKRRSHKLIPGRGVE